MYIEQLLLLSVSVRHKKDTTSRKTINNLFSEKFFYVFKCYIFPERFAFSRAKYLIIKEFSIINK